MIMAWFQSLSPLPELIAVIGVFVAICMAEARI
jgi:hypothetical protein